MTNRENLKCNKMFNKKCSLSKVYFDVVAMTDGTVVVVVTSCGVKDGDSAEL